MKRNLFLFPLFFLAFAVNTCYNKRMVEKNRQQNSLLAYILGERTQEKASGLAFSAATALPYVLSLLFVLVGSVFGLFYEGHETADWYLYVNYLLSQCSFAAVAAIYFLTAKRSVKTVVGKPKLYYFAVALILQYGLFSLGGVNEWFLGVLEGWGLIVPAPQVPSLEGWGLLGVIIVVAVLPAVFEETLFRGVVLKGLQSFPAWAAALICGALFSLFHQSPAQTLYQFLCGVAFALVAIRSGSILPTVLAHFCNNTVVILAEKFGWDMGVLPVTVTSAICLVLSLAFLVFDTVKAERKQAAEGVKSDPGLAKIKTSRKQFFLCTLFGVVVCVLGWIFRLVA